MRRVMWIGGGLVALLLGLVSYLFVVQNSGRSTQLSLDLYLAAGQLSDPISVMALAGIALGIGFLIGLVVMLPGGRRLRKRIRSLEQQIALGGDATSSWK